MKRREFLKNIELIGIGCVAGGFLAPVVTSCGGGSASAIQVKLPDLPFKYVELDPDEVASAAYRGYYANKKISNGVLHGCAYGTFNAIISILARKVGFPYTVIPTAMMNYGRGGDCETLCGALNEIAAAIQLVSPDPDEIIDSLNWWYATTELPQFVPSSDDIDAVVNQLKAAGKSDDTINAYKAAASGQTNKSTATSLLSQTSLAKWLKANPGLGIHTAERGERCARLVADTAAKAVEFLNQQIIHKNFEPLPTASSDVENCLSCHGKGQRDDTKLAKGVTCMNCHSADNVIDPKTHPSM